MKPNLKKILIEGFNSKGKQQKYRVFTKDDEVILYNPLTDKIIIRYDVSDFNMTEC